MKQISWILALFMSGLAICPTASGQADESIAPMRAAAQKLQQDGNYKEALDAFRKLVLEVDGNQGAPLAEDLSAAFTCTRAWASNQRWRRCSKAR